MLRDRYEAVDIFVMVPQLSHSIDPVIAQLDTLLDDDTIFEQVRSDLCKRYPRTQETGRPSTPVEVILRMLVIKHLYGWSYAQTEQWVSDSLVLRDFCRICWQQVPDDTTLIRWANLIQADTLHQLLDHVVQMACQLKVTRGRKLRTDCTVVETNIHYPTDSSLLNDGVRVISRTLKAARRYLRVSEQLGLGEEAQELFRDRTRSAKRLAKEIIDTLRSRGEEAGELRKAGYQRLITIGEAMLEQAKRVGELLGEQTSGGASGGSCGEAHGARKVAERLGEFVPRLQAVVEQTKRRVLQGETVPAGEKVVSIFEPETATIRKGKLRKPTSNHPSTDHWSLTLSANACQVALYSSFSVPGRKDASSAFRLSCHSSGQVKPCRARRRYSSFSVVENMPGSSEFTVA